MNIERPTMGSGTGLSGASQADGGGSGRPGRAFTLIELIVVITIMSLLAALVVGMAQHAAESKRRNRVQAELSKWATMIDAYHDKLGFYPPSNPALTIQGTNVGLAVTPLYYELCGADMDASGLVYTNLHTRETIEKRVVNAAFGVAGLVNAASEKGEARCFGANIQPAEVVAVSLQGVSVPVKLPRVPVKGPAPWADPNVWHYNSRNPTNNPNSYDLWAEYVVGNSTNVIIIGNWKR